MSTYKLEELAEAAGVSPRTVRYYVQRGLLPPPEFKGSQTTYGAIHVALLAAIKSLQGRHLPLEEIAIALAGKSVEALERIARGDNSTRRVSKSAAGSPYRDAPVIAPSEVVEAPRAATWERVELVPGVEIHVRTDAGPLARRVANEIRKNYGPYFVASKEQE